MEEIIENVLISNIAINQSRCPIFIRIGDRGRVIKGVSKPIPGYIKHVVITDVKGKSNFIQGSLITGINDHLIEDVVIRNMNIEMEGGGTSEMANAAVVEDEGGYPDAHQFSKKGLPSYGFYVRHAKNIQFDNVKVTPTKSDHRPEFKSGGDNKSIIINGKELGK
jgi:hypothetical protein